MKLDNTAGHWGAVAKSLHWAIAALVLIQLPLGFYARMQKEAMVAAVDMSRIEDVTAIFDLHKSIGIVIGLLVITRIVWRLTHYVPPLSGELPAYMRALAHLTHWALYALLIALPASGYVISVGSHIEIDFFYLFHIPNLFEVSEAARQTAETVHMVCVWMLVAFTVLHIGAALFHHFALKDDTMVKILPAFLGGRGGPMKPFKD